MIFDLIEYLRNTITPFDRIKGFKTKKPKIGWLGVFPPYQNGAAAVSYYFVRRLLKRKDIEVALIPINNKIEKSKFKGAVYCKIDNPSLDAIIFWCLGDKFRLYSVRTKGSKALKAAWQTIHFGKKEDVKNQLLEISDADLKILMTSWAFKEAKKELSNCAAVPFGVDTSYFRPGRKDRFEVIFVSRIHYYKGVMPFLDTIPYVLNECPDIVFKLHSPMDRFSPHISEMEKAIRETKKRYPTNFFHDSSWRPYHKMKDIYRSASVLAFPSNNEGFGIPLLEAMACGAPCIVSDVPPMNEIVVKNTGFVLKQKKAANYHGFAFPNPKDMARRIISLRKNKKYNQKMSDNCRKHIQKNYELSKTADDFVNLVVKEIKSRSRK